MRMCVSQTTGRTANLGLGFGDRSDSFDLNVALQDHFKWVKNQEKIEQDKIQPPPELDLGFKQGETIRINMKFTVSNNLLGLLDLHVKGRGETPFHEHEWAYFFLSLFEIISTTEQ